MKYDIAIITVSTNRLDEACLTSVARVMKATPLKTCFIVVDNASTKFDAYEYATSRAPGTIVLHQKENYGFGRSCNRGAKEVDADYYFFLNPDTRIDDDQLLSKLHAFLKKDPSVGIVAPRLRYMDGRIQETCRRFPEWYMPIYQRLSFLAPKRAAEASAKFLMEDFNHATTLPIDWAQGSALMMDGALFHRLGGFDERFWMYFEDIDLCRRTWEQGRTVYYLPDVELYHVYGKESAKSRNVASALLFNQKARTHIASWIKYTMKWRGRRV